MDKEAKAREIKALLMGDAAALEKAIESLGDSDPVTQEWATVALRKWKGDPERARKALLDFFEEHDREALRCYALDALGRLGTHIPIDRLPDLIGQYPDTPKPMVLGKALHWIAKVSDLKDSTILPKLLDLGQRYPDAWPGHRGFLKRHRAAVCTLALRELNSARRPKDWFHANGASWVLDELGESRIEKEIKKEIKKERALLEQHQVLLHSEELEVAQQDLPLVPGIPLDNDYEVQYAQDAAAVTNTQVVTRTVHVRISAVAKEAKRLSRNLCQVCGDGLPSSGEATRFVHAHHFVALSDRGLDDLKNMVVLCPSCHAKAHSKSFELVAENGLFRLVQQVDAHMAPENARCKVLALIPNLTRTARREIASKLAELEALESD